MQHFSDTLFRYADGFLILFYRMTGESFVDYLIGTFVLGFICVIVGEISVSLAINFNKRFVDEMTREMNSKEKLSIEAYQAGDRKTYEALNKQATDAWGRRFFTMAAYSAGILWPIPFALGWMQIRFQGVEFRLAAPLSLLFGKSVGYTFTFIPLYILARILFSKVRKYLPYFKGVEKKLKEL